MQSEPLITVNISEEQLENLRKPGKGGFQGKIEKLLRYKDPSKMTLTIPLHFGVELVKYYEDYGVGGYQSRMKPIYEQLKRLVADLDRKK